MQTGPGFETITDVLQFLESSEYSDAALIEVVRKCYFSYREGRAFEHYVAYLTGKRQSDIGFFLNYSQGTVSLLFKKCRDKLKFFRTWFSRPVKDHLAQLQTICTPKEFNVLMHLLSGKKMVEVAKKFSCTKFNISLLCSHALIRTEKADPALYKWLASMLVLLKTVKSVK